MNGNEGSTSWIVGEKIYLFLVHGLQYLPFISMKTKRLSTSRKLLLGLLCLSVGWIFFRWLPLNSSH